MRCAFCDVLQADPDTEDLDLCGPCWRERIAALRHGMRAVGVTRWHEWEDWEARRRAGTPAQASRQRPVYR